MYQNPGQIMCTSMQEHHESSSTEWVLYLLCGIFIKNQSQSQNKADFGLTKNFKFSKVLSQNKGYIKAVVE